MKKRWPSEATLTSDSERFSLEKLFALSLDMLCIAGIDGMFKQINPAFERTLGWSTDDLLGRPFLEFIHPDDVGATRRELQSLAEGKTTFSFENRYRCADGSYKHLLWTAKPDPDTDVVYAVARDVTEQKKTDRELRRAKEAAEAAAVAKSRFLAHMSHEIRTPMNGVIGMTDLALRESHEPTVREYLKIAQQSADSLLGLIDDVLDFSKIEAGRIELDSRPFSLRDCVASAARSLGLQAHRKQLELIYQIDPEVGDGVVGDPQRLRQVLVNLVANAVKFTERGEVSIEVVRESRSEESEQLLFEVRDTGVGIPADEHARVFESFSQLRGPSGGSRPGTGLGLAISAELVQLMGGRIWIESEPGVGSSFFFTARFGIDDHAARLVAPRGLEGQRILVVDDNATQRSSLTRVLGLWGLEPVAAASAAEGLSLVEQARSTAHPFDIVLVDQRMPEMTGIELARQVRDREGRSERIILMLTTIDPAEEIGRSQWPSVGTFLMKPLMRDELAHALEGRFRGAGAGLASSFQRRRKAQRSLHVLVVEDSDVNQKVALGLLESQGHRVELAADGAAALAAIEAGGWDVVLMDVELPVMGGLEVTRLVRAAEQGGGRHVPIVAMTAHAIKGDRERCLEAGMDAYVSKPIRAQELFRTIAKTLDSFGTPSGMMPVIKEPPCEVSWSSALSAVGGNRSLLRVLTEAVIDEAPGLVAMIEQALESADGERLRELAHRLKGVTRYFSPDTLHEEVLELEAAGRDGDLGRARTLLAELGPRLEALVRALGEFLQMERESGSNPSLAVEMLSPRSPELDRKKTG